MPPSAQMNICAGRMWYGQPLCCTIAAASAALAAMARIDPNIDHHGTCQTAQPIVANDQVVDAPHATSHSSRAAGSRTAAAHAPAGRTYQYLTQFNRFGAGKRKTRLHDKARLKQLIFHLFPATAGGQILRVLVGRYIVRGRSGTGRTNNINKDSPSIMAM